MGAHPLWHWLIVLFLVALTNLPALWVLKKIGWSRWLVILAMLPLVNLVFLWFMAFSPWPTEAPAKQVAW